MGGKGYLISPSEEEAVLSGFVLKNSMVKKMIKLETSSNKSQCTF
jgi:hypothetical protein